MKKKCLDCDNLITLIAKRCRACNTLHLKNSGLRRHIHINKSQATLDRKERNRKMNRYYYIGNESASNFYLNNLQKDVPSIPQTKVLKKMLNSIKAQEIKNRKYE